MASLMDRLRRYQPDDDLDFNSLPEDLSRLGAGVDPSKIGRLPQKVASGALLPMSRYDDGSVSFDPEAGLLGSAADGLSAPYRAYTGDLEDPEGEALNMAGWLMGSGFGRAVGSKAGAELGSAGGKLSRVSDDLPMDFESRMARAREMGFDVDTPLYHGTTSPENFSSVRAGATTKFDGSDYVDDTDYFFTAVNDPEYANGYASVRRSVDERETAPRVMKLLGRSGKELDLTDLGSSSISPENFRSVFQGAGGYLPRSFLDNLDETLFDRINQQWPEPYFYLEMPEVKNAIKEGGFNSVLLREQSDWIGQPTTSKAFIDPSRVRSIHAAFDPDKIESDDLLAAGSPFMPLMPREKREKK